MSWKILTVCGANILELLDVYSDFGVLGAEEVSESEIRLYVETSHFEPLREDFSKILAQNDLQLTNEEIGEDQNWTIQCEELLEPLILGDIRVVPLHSARLPEKREARDLFLYVGMGFGTGHHATTHMMIEELQKLPDVPSSVLDVGAGSGILSVAAVKHFNAQVCAIEYDRDACENAEVNFTLNGVQDSIEMRAELYTPSSTRYDLIIANVYTEILCQNEGGFYQQLAPGKALLLSGIQQKERGQILGAFREPRWHLESERERSGWMFFRLRRNS